MLYEVITLGGFGPAGRNAKYPMPRGRFNERSFGSQQHVERAEEALKTGAQAIAGNCPFCLTMLREIDAQNGAKEKPKAAAKPAKAAPAPAPAPVAAAPTTPAKAAASGPVVLDAVRYQSSDSYNFV